MPSSQYRCSSDGADDESAIKERMSMATILRNARDPPSSGHRVRTPRRCIRSTLPVRPRQAVDAASPSARLAAHDTHVRRHGCPQESPYWGRGRVRCNELTDLVRTTPRSPPDRGVFGSFPPPRIRTRIPGMLGACQWNAVHPSEEGDWHGPEKHARHRRAGPLRRRLARVDADARRCVGSRTRRVRESHVHGVQRLASDALGTVRRPPRAASGHSFEGGSVHAVFHTTDDERNALSLDARRSRATGERNPFDQGAVQCPIVYRIASCAKSTNTTGAKPRASCDT